MKMSMLLLSATFCLHVPFIILLFNQFSEANPRHSVHLVAAVFLFSWADVAHSHVISTQFS